VSRKSEEEKKDLGLEQSAQTHSGIIQAGYETGKRLLRSLPYWFYGGAILLIALGLKVGLLASGAFPFNADEAVVGLMARHILQGHKPIFFYGQVYMGSLDPLLVALGFAVFGQKVLVIRLVQLLLYLGTVLTTMQLARRIFNSTLAAIIAGLLMAIPTVNVTLYTTVSLGGYGEALLIGNLLLLLTLRIVDNPTENWPYAAWGILAGLGFWTFGLTIVYSLPGAIVIGWVVVRRLKSRSGLMGVFSLLIGAIAGAAPLIVWLIFNDPELLAKELTGSAIAGASPNNLIAVIGAHGFNLLLLGSLVIWGIRPPWEVRWLALPLLPFAFAFWLVVMVHGLLKLREAAPERLARWLLAGVTCTLLTGFVISPFGADPSGRYFLPLAVVMALGAADLLMGSKTRLHNPWGSVLLVGVLAFNLWGTIESAKRNPPGLTTQFDAVTQIDHSFDQQLIAFLENESEARGYANYWVAYPLAFLSQERLIYIPRLPYHLDFRYTNRDNRYQPYTQTVVTSPSAAYITTNHPELDNELRTLFRAHDVGWQEAHFGNYHVFYNLSDPLSPEELGASWLE
jgi:4-amino-4-deoxy-L-arabinose transferase-like glycosyltransferase